MTDSQDLITTAEPDEMHAEPEFEQMLERVFEQGLEQGLEQGPAEELTIYHDESDKKYIEQEFTLEGFARWFGVQHLGSHPYNAIGFHHTYRPVPEQWRGLASLHAIFVYYNTHPKYQWPWGQGPHFFVYSGEGPYRRGFPHVYVARHPAFSGYGITGFNQRVVHVEHIIDGDAAAFSETLMRVAGQVLAILCSRHPFADREIPLQFVKGGRDNPPQPLGIMFHRDINPDWKPGAWPKSCPGLKVSHENLDPVVLRSAREHFPWNWSSNQGGEEFVFEVGSLVATQGALARSEPSRQGFEVLKLTKGQRYATEGYTNVGENVDGSSRWYRLSATDYMWVHSGGGKYSSGS